MPPLLVVWEPGAEVIGDFTWPGFNDEVIVSDRVRRALEPAFCCIEFHPVEMVDPRSKQRPAGAKQRGEPRVPVPYNGPPLWDMVPTAWCGIDQDASGVRLTRECPVCGHLFWEPNVVAPRFVVDGRTWDGADIFRIDAYPGAHFCTERVKQFVEEHRFTNVAFDLRGEIGDPATARGPLGPFRRRPIDTTAAATAEAAEAQMGIPGFDLPAITASPGLGEIAAANPEMTYLADNSPASCQVDMQDIIGYLAAEIPDEEISADDLEFVRTAAIEDWQCWLWQFVDVYGEDAYVSASAWPTGSSVLYEPARGRTPEQFILFDYGLYQRDFRSGVQDS